MPDKNVSKPQIQILEASAGSGKTYALAKHFLQLIINPGGKAGETPLKNIIAITFTNKASIEMKTRVFDLLKKVALDSFTREDERSDIIASLGVPEKEARKKAFALMDYIIGNYGSFRIQTIDSFINEIISSSSFRLGLSAQFDIKTDYGEYFTRGLDMLIENSQRDKQAKETLSEFINQYLYIEGRTGWLPQKNILSVVADLYGKVNTFGGSFVKTVEFSSRDVLALKTSAAGKMKKLIECLPEKTNKIFKDKLMKLIIGPGERFSIGDLGKYFTREELPVNKGCGPHEKAEKLFGEVRRDIAALARTEALSFYNCYIDLYNLVIKYFDALSRKDDVMFLSELNRRANEVFADGGGGAVPELYYRMSARFRHFLIDEFQDTSVIQWRNVRPMAEEILSGGGSLFYVGDKKQAIYRFRGGDAGLFDSVPESFPLIASSVEILDKNYRSRRELMGLNNELFSKANIGRFIADFNAENEDKQFSEAAAGEILKIYSASEQKPGRDNPGGYVRVRHLDAKNNDERDELMRGEFTELIRSVSERYAFKDIAVLARQNDDIELFTGWLLKEGIPAESEKTLDLKENPAVKEILSFLMFLDSPIDDAAFASFLTGDIFAAVSGLSPAETQMFIFEVGCAGGDSVHLYKAFRDKFPELWNDYFEQFFVSVGFMPPYELVVSVLNRFRVAANFARYQGFLAHLLELIKENEREHGSLKAFLEYLLTAPDKEMFIRFSGADSVKLMTVHKAKGLEFPVVVIPYLTMDISPAEGKGSGGPYFAGRSDGGLSLIKLNRDYASYSEELGRLYDENLKRSLIDELNAVYVALTRAKDELYVYIPAKCSNKKNAARLFVGGEREAGLRTAKTKDSALKPNMLSNEACGDWIKILKNEFTGVYEPGLRSAALEGEAIHYGLSFIGNLKGADVDEALNEAALRMKARYAGLERIEALSSNLRATVKAPAFKSIFSVENGSIRSEQELLDRYGATKRLDRLIETDEAVIAVDFKSSREDGQSHKTQLKVYMELLKEIYPSRKVEGWIAYLDTMTVEDIT